MQRRCALSECIRMRACAGDEQVRDVLCRRENRDESVSMAEWRLILEK